MKNRMHQTLAIAGVVVTMGAGSLALGNPDKAAYLGVHTSPVDPTTASHLGLQEGVGLVVEYVDPESPAGKVLEEHDVLHKLDNQLLVSHHQLAVLVRGHKPGDSVTLGIKRKGETTDVQAVLEEKELPPIAAATAHHPQVQILPPVMRSFSVDHVDPQAMNEQIQQAIAQAMGDVQIEQGRMELLQQEIEEQIKNITGSIYMGATGDADSYSISSSAHSAVKVLSDGDMTLTLTVTDDNKNLKAQKSGGTVLFDGPVNTEEERAKMPPEVADKYQRLDQAGKTDIIIDTHAPVQPGATTTIQGKVSI